ncbi:MAG: phage holin family protein [Verrucomicrobiales bacterium]|nr:phage holin family protein [Verrucomicrobiales bacterium]
MDSPDSSRSSAKGGLGDAVIDALIGSVDCFHARLNLLQFEAKEAGTDLVVRLICFLVAAIFCGLAYLITLVGGIAWVSISQEWTWYKVTLIVAGIHLLLAVILVAIGKRRFGRKPFRDSVDEFKRDREWLEEMRREK